MRIGTTGLQPPAENKSMKNDFNLTPPTSMMRLSSGRVEHQNVGGVLFMNIYKPKPLPKDIAERCIEALSHRLGQLEIDQCHNRLEWHVYMHEKSKLKLYLIYYRECIRLHEKGLTNG